MRRRIRSAAFPVHRHAIPQLVIDGLLVALAYLLAFRLRFEDGFSGAEPSLRAAVRRDDPLGRRWSRWSALAAFGQYQRLWRYVGQRDYEAVLKGVVVATVIVVGGIALLHPVEAPTTHSVF